MYKLIFHYKVWSGLQCCLFLFFFLATADCSQCEMALSALQEFPVTEFTEDSEYYPEHLSSHGNSASLVGHLFCEALCSK